MTRSASTSARPIALVTGGTGFLGTHLLRLLTADPEAAKRVRVLAHSKPPAWLRALGVEIAEGSVTSPDDVNARWTVSARSTTWPVWSRTSRPTATRCTRCTSTGRASSVKRPRAPACDGS